MKKISVIVPVYNVETQLEKCVNSIINQSYSNIEIILVDDGSKDSSSSICDLFISRDTRVKVYHKGNEGLVATRKFGVSKATGDYIAFVDGDDWIEQDMYQYMMSAINEKTDISLVTSGLKYEWSDRSDEISDALDEGLYEFSESKKRILYNLINDEDSSKQNILTSVCNKLFDAEIMRKVILKIDDDVTLGEDGVLLCNFVAMSKNVFITHYVGYHYIQHEDSMIHKNTINSFEKIYKMKNCFETTMNDLGIQQIMQSQIDFYTRCFLNNVINDVYKLKPFSAYVFPYEDLPNNTRVILYGAGQVGNCYKKYILDTKCVELIGIADAEYLNMQKNGRDIYNIYDLVRQDFDYILIAIEDEKIANNIKNNMILSGVDEKKILWRPVKWKAR